MRAGHVVLIVASLSLGPVLAFDGGSTAPRTDTAAVVGDAAAFVKVTNLAPTLATRLVLVNGNGYEDNVLVVQNLYSSSITLQASLPTNPQGRFTLPNPTATLAPGAQHTLKLQDDDPVHKRACTSVVVQVDAYLGGTGAARRGHATVARQAFVEVKTAC